MSMYEIIKSSAIQFSFDPKIENENKLKKHSKYIIVGMGGSHLAGDLLKLIEPNIDVIIHNSYGLPAFIKEELSSRLIILSSYSGNTEEVLEAQKEAEALGLSCAVIAVGGKLLENAKKNQTPYIEMPNLNIQPRCALALNLKSLLKIIGNIDALNQITELKDTFKPESKEQDGKNLAQQIKGCTPIIYASEKNKSIAYNWKIKFNETGKIPAFYNVLPELNHNEMTGFDVRDTTEKLSEKFCFVFLKDENDHEKIQKRMSITQKLYQDKKLPCFEIKMEGNNIFEKIFYTLTIADFAAYFTAEIYGLESEQVPMVEEFKKLIES